MPASLCIFFQSKSVWPEFPRNSPKIKSIFCAVDSSKTNGFLPCCLFSWCCAVPTSKLGHLPYFTAQSCPHLHAHWSHTFLFCLVCVMICVYFAFHKRCEIPQRKDYKTLILNCVLLDEIGPVCIRTLLSSNCAHTPAIYSNTSRHEFWTCCTHIYSCSATLFSFLKLLSFAFFDSLLHREQLISFWLRAVSHFTPQMEAIILSLSFVSQQKRKVFALIACFQRKGTFPREEKEEK